MFSLIKVNNHSDNISIIINDIKVDFDANLLDKVIGALK